MPIIHNKELEGKLLQLCEFGKLPKNSFLLNQRTMYVPEKAHIQKFLDAERSKENWVMAEKEDDNQDAEMCLRGVILAKEADVENDWLIAVRAYVTEQIVGSAKIREG